MFECTNESLYFFLESKPLVNRNSWHSRILKTFVYFLWRCLIKLLSKHSQSFLATCSTWSDLFLTVRRCSLFCLALFCRSSGPKESGRVCWLPTLPCLGWWSWTPTHPSALFTTTAESSREWFSVQTPEKFDKFPATSSPTSKKPVRLRETRGRWDSSYIVSECSKLLYIIYNNIWVFFLLFRTRF